MVKPPFKPLTMAPAAVDIERRDDGTTVLRSPQALAAYPRCVGAMLDHWAVAAPERDFLAERALDGGWRRVTYGQARATVRATAQSLLDRSLSPERPVMILSDNAIDNGLLQLAAMHVGIPAAPISPAYSLLSGDLGKLKYIAALLRPGMVYADDGHAFAKALGGADFGDAEIVIGANPPDGMRVTAFDSLGAAQPTGAVDDAFAAVGPETVAKLLFTSGSTGPPKGVINTQRMLCSNQQAIKQLWPFLGERPPVIVDWLPWNHTFGANHNVNMILWHGGTLYIDKGKPAPGLIETTVANLGEIPSTIHFNVPRGFDMLLPFLEQDESLRRTFFQDLGMIFYAGAALPQNLWLRLEKLAVETLGKRIIMASAWGATETAPMATAVHFPIERAGIIGLPAPGSEIKMVPEAGKFELRVRGPNVTPGYWRRDDLTAMAFDEDGYYRIGDAGKFADDDDPAQGLIFDGRLTEDFKLMSGTWVHVGALRIKAITAGAPVIQDAVVTADGRENVGLLIFADANGCRGLCPDAGPETAVAALIARPEVHRVLCEGLNAYNAINPGNSSRIDRVLLMAEPPSIDAGEITDKGYINQRAVLEKRRHLVDELYAGDLPHIILLD